MRRILFTLVFMIIPFFAAAQTQKERDRLSSLDRDAISAYNEGDYSTAVTLIEQAYALTLSAWPEDDPEAVAVTNSLAFLYSATGRFAEAESLYLRALKVRERVLGPEHPDTLTSVNNLAALYQATGRFAEAEPLYLRALEARERKLGSEHPDTLGSINNLAALYEAMGRLDEAEPLYLRALEASERVFGPEKPETLNIVNNLAALYEAMGRFAEAEPLYLRALEGQELELGIEHRETLVSVNNLAGLYEATGRLAEAEPLYLRAMEASERVFGPEHPVTLTIVNNLAGLYQATNRLDEAERLFLRALDANERESASEDPDTLISVNNLAALYYATGRFAEAEPLYLRALEASERVLGPEHPQTLSSVNNLAALYEATGRFAEAESLYLRALEASERVLGPEHPDTLSSVKNLVFLRLSAGNPDAVATAVLSLSEALNASARRIGSELRAGANDAQRANLSGDSFLRNISVAAALRYPEHVSLGARALLMTKGIAGETDATLARLVAGDQSEDIQDAAMALRRAEGQLHASYQSNDPDQIEPARQARDAARRALFRLIDPPLAFAPESITPEAITEALPEGTLFLDYGIYAPVDFATGNRSEPHILLAAYRPGQAVVLMDLGPASSITPAILATTDAGNFTEDLGREHWLLREVLLDPVQAMLAEAREVIISPDGILARVNFALLQDPEQTSHHLVERLPVRIVPSGRSLLAQPAEAPEPEAVFLGVGLTDFGPYDPERCVRAPDRSAEGGLCPLQNTVAEIEQISRDFEAAHQLIRAPLLEAAATEAAVTAAMPRTRFIQLATHGGAQLAGYGGEGLHNVGLAFHGIGDRGVENRIPTPANDGILSGYEVTRLQLWGTDLVAMSACNTALGEEAAAEGIWSMAYAFRLAGANAVMMTLWNVNDDSAPDFMEHFYRTLLERQQQYPGEPIRTALRTALRDTRLWAINEGWSYWDYGPFVLVES